MDNIPRLLFYSSGTLIVSTAFTLLTTELLKLVSNTSFLGTIILLFFGLIYMNMTFISSRRFYRRLESESNTPYYFGFLVFLPVIIWINIYDTGLGWAEYLYVGTIFFACALGAFFGKKAGFKAQQKFKAELSKYLNQDSQ